MKEIEVLYSLQTQLWENTVRINDNICTDTNNCSSDSVGELVALFKEKLARKEQEKRNIMAIIGVFD